MTFSNFGLKWTLKSEERAKFPHLFHDPLDNEPPPAWFCAAEQHPNYARSRALWEDAAKLESLACRKLIIKRLSRH